MAYCSKCGAEVTGNFCTNCGAPVNAAQTEVPSAGYTQPTGAPQYTPAPQAAAPVNPADPSGYKLGWHKFLIYLSLWASALIDIYNGADSMSVASYYAPLGVYGVLCFASAVFAIYVRFQLAKFKAGAPKKLLIFNVLTVILNLFYIGMAASLNVSDSSMVGAMVGSVALVIINWRYYSSREPLFVN